MLLPKSRMQVTSFMDIYKAPKAVTGKKRSQATANTLPEDLSQLMCATGLKYKAAGASSATLVDEDVTPGKLPRDQRLKNRRAHHLLK